MKKYLTSVIAAAIATLFTACSNEDVLQPSQQDEKGNGTFIQLSFQFQSSTSSRAAEYNADGSESSGQYVQGEDYEYRIKKVYLYFFKKHSDTYTAVPISEGKYYEEYVVSQDDLTSSTVESSSAADGKAVTWTDVVRQLPSKIEIGGTYRVYALINRPVTGTITSEADLLNSTLNFDQTEVPLTTDNDDITTIDSKNVSIPMAARSQKGDVYAEITPTAQNNFSNPCELDYEVERSYARVAFMNDTFTFPIYKSNEATAETDVVGQAEIVGYQLVNKNKIFYAYRHVGSINDESEVSFATDGSQYGPITSSANYVIDPITNLKKSEQLAPASYFLNPLSEAQSVSYANIDNLATKTQFYRLQPASGSTPKSVEYVAENTMERDAQLKGQTTGIIFLVRFGFKDDAQRAANLVDKKAGTSNKWSVGHDLYYMDGKFYASLEDLQGKNADITYANMSEYGVRYFKNGIGYYEYYIRHYNNGDNTEMGIMEFGIVRNNSYELSINKMSMSPYSKLPGDDPEEYDPENPQPIDPDSPDPDDPDESAKIYMSMTVKVRPWIVRTNSVDLGH